MIQHWYHCKVCDIGDNEGRCLACSISCKKKGHALNVYYSAFFCDEGYHKDLIQQRSKKEQSKCAIL